MRPAGQVRVALLAVLQAGIVGTFDVLARHANVPESQARQTLWDLRREGLATSSRPRPIGAGRPQHLRAIYAPAANDGGPFDPVSFARQVWR